MKTLSIIVLVLLLGVFSFYPHTTGPTEVGVRTIKWSLFAKQGVEDHVYAPGAVYFFPVDYQGPNRYSHRRSTWW